MQMESQHTLESRNTHIILKCKMQHYRYLISYFRQINNLLQLLLLK